MTAGSSRKVAAQRLRLDYGTLQGYEGLAGPSLRMPVKKTKGIALTEDQRQYNLLVRGVHAVAERANSLLKTTFKALRRVSLCPWRIGAIAKAALVLLHLEHGRPLPSHGLTAVNTAVIWCRQDPR